jgi:hypothetical protein
VLVPKPRPKTIEPVRKHTPQRQQRPGQRRPRKFAGPGRKSTKP